MKGYNVNNSTMKRIYLFALVVMMMTAPMSACSSNDDAPDTSQPTSSEIQTRGSKTLVAFFSATNNTKAVADEIVRILGADQLRIQAANPYAANPYDDQAKIQQEAYNDLRPSVANLPSKEDIARYDTIFIGSPTWWHQPAMVICTFLESYDLTGKVVIPFFTYSATTYLNESMQKIYKVTPNSTHIPATLPEDIDPDDIQHPQNDDAGIPTAARASNVESWLREIGVLGNGQTAIGNVSASREPLYAALFTPCGHRVASGRDITAKVPGLYILQQQYADGSIDSRKIVIR